MGFQIPSLQLPKLPELSLDSALSKLTETFDPSSMVGQVSGNVTSQQGSIEGMRSQLEGMRSQMQQASSAADFQAMSKYTAGLQQMTDVACIMSSSKPAFTPMTPNSLSNPLAESATSAGGGLMSEAIGSYLGVPPSVADAVMSGNVNTLTSPDTLTDLSIAGIGVYASGMTGGVIQPQMASSVINSVAGESVRGAVSGSLSGDFVRMPTELGNSPGVLGGLTSAIGSDPTGGMMESSINQAIPGSMNYVDPNNLASMSQSDVTDVASSLLNSYNPDGYTGMLGGINMSNPTALATGLDYAGLNRAVELGDVEAATNFTNHLLDYNQPPTFLYDQIDNLSQTMPQTPGNMENYMNVRSMLESEIQDMQAEYEFPIDHDIIDPDVAREHNALLNSLGATQNESILPPSTEYYDNLPESIPMSQQYTDQYSIYPNYVNGEQSGYIVQERLNYPDIPVEQVNEPQNCNWFTIACNTVNTLANNAISNAPIIERSIISIVESNKRSDMYRDAMDLRCNALASGGRMAEQVLGKDKARKGKALKDVVKSFKK